MPGVGLVEELENSPQAIVRGPRQIGAAEFDGRLGAVRAGALPDELLGRGIAAGVREILAVEVEAHGFNAVAGHRLEGVGEMRVGRAAGVERFGKGRGLVEERHELRGQSHVAYGGRDVLRSLLGQQLLQVLVVELPERAIRFLEESVDLVHGGLRGGRRIERKLVQHRTIDTAQRLAFAVQLRGTERAQQRFDVGDGIFHQLLHHAFDVGVGIDAERLRHLFGGHVRVHGVGQGGGRGRVVGGCLRHRVHRRLQGHQGVHVRLVGRRDVAINKGGRHGNLHGLEGVRHVGQIHRGILRGQREQRQQRRLIAGERAEFLGGVRQAGVAHHAGGFHVSAPGLDVIGVVAVGQLLSQLGAVDAGGVLVAQHPGFAGEILFGVAQGGLHEVPARLGIGRRDILVVDDFVGRAGEALVEVDRRPGLGGVGHHGLVDALEAGELREVETRFADGGGVVIVRIRIGDFQLVAVELELFLRQLHAVGVHVAVGAPAVQQHRRQEVAGGLVMVGGGFQVGLEAVIGGLVFGARGRGRQAAHGIHENVLGGQQQQAAEIGEVELAHVGVEVVADIQAPAIAQGRRGDCNR